jgi:hypothetical protein
MKFLLKPGQYSKFMRECSVTPEQWLERFEHPPVLVDKSRAPLAIYGTLVENPELDPESGLPRCTGANVASLYALQLDYDSGMSIERFRERYGKYRWSLYTSHSHGYKGDSDRFRVVMPLKDPLPCDVLRSGRVKRNLTTWHFPGADPTFADRGHWQILCCKREPDAPYIHIQNPGEPFGGKEYWDEYAAWAAEEDAASARRLEAARKRTVSVDKTLLLQELQYELSEIPTGVGVRHSDVKKLLSRYVRKGLREELLSLGNPWPEDRNWDREWSSLVEWFVSRPE